jgi:DIM1 family U5 snRNP protein
MTMDETLYSVADKVANFAVIYLADITEVPDFNKVRRLGSVCRIDLFNAESNHRCTSCTTHAQ